MVTPFADSRQARCGAGRCRPPRSRGGFPAGTVVDSVAAAFNDKVEAGGAVTQRVMLSPASEGSRFSETAVRLNVPPGRYEVRSAMRSTADNRAGSVYASVTVPNFAREPLSLSGMSSSRSRAAQRCPRTLPAGAGSADHRPGVLDGCTCRRRCAGLPRPCEDSGPGTRDRADRGRQDA